jgi:Fic family protein
MEVGTITINRGFDSRASTACCKSNLHLRRNFRDGPVVITGAQHTPPHHGEVPDLVDQMCLYVNSNWNKTPVHLASYVMWRMNWIHPFFGGNGRTARATSYLILCARLGFKLPGTLTIPEQIVAKREPYFNALQAADIAWQAGIVNLTDMESLLESLLAAQLLAIHKQATGKNLP